MESLTRESKKRAKGVLLLGVPGVGKSAFAKALGAETGRLTLILDIGALFDSLVGQIAQSIRGALQVADAMRLKRPFQALAAMVTRGFRPGYWGRS